jgi:hypothetical protein
VCVCVCVCVFVCRGGVASVVLGLVPPGAALPVRVGLGGCILVASKDFLIA